MDGTRGPAGLHVAGKRRRQLRPARRTVGRRGANAGIRTLERRCAPARRHGVARNPAAARRLCARHDLAAGGRGGRDAAGRSAGAEPRRSPPGRRYVRRLPAACQYRLPAAAGRPAQGAHRDALGGLSGRAGLHRAGVAQPRGRHRGGRSRRLPAPPEPAQRLLAGRTGGKRDRGRALPGAGRCALYRVWRS